MPDAVKKVKSALKGSLCRISPALYSKYLFRRILGKSLDLKNPKGMNEKLMWLKLYKYADDPLVAQCADKYAVRQYVEACGCGDTLNEIYGAWEKAEDIPWDELPDAFVLKCNHGCGYNLICPDKAACDHGRLSRTLENWMHEDYWLSLGELHYRHIPKRIICEKFLGQELIDYKIYCFHGVPKFVMVCIGRDSGLPSHTGCEEPRFYFFNEHWELCRLTRDGRKAPEGFSVPRPQNLDRMLSVAAKLSEPFPFVRVDLYDIEGKTVFGELTFTPSGALDADRLPETDKMFGDMIAHCI